MSIGIAVATALPGAIQSAVQAVSQAFGAEAPVEEKKKPGVADATEQGFLDYARMSVGERIRDQYLKKAGLTEDSLGQLDAKSRSKIEEEIRDKIREAMTQNGGKDSGSIANIVV